MIDWAAIETTVKQNIEKDFDKFDFTDKPMEKYCAYNRTKHIQMATQIVIQAFGENADSPSRYVADFIHGLNHIFFNGVAAGQSFERFKAKE